MTPEEKRTQHAAYMRAWHQKNPGKNAEYRRKQYSADPAALARAYEKRRQWRQDNLEEQRARERAKAAKLRAEQPELHRERTERCRQQRMARRMEQAGRVAPLLCEICGRTSLKGDKLVYDHCHQTGKFRGWLCDQCNWALGQVNDDPRILRAMIRYLEKAKR